MLGAHVGIAGYFKIEAVKPDGSRRELAPWQPNLVTDAGLDFPGQYAHILFCMQYCRLGTGSTPPTFADTALDNQIAAVAYLNGDYTTTGVSGAVPYYKFERVTYIFTPGMATGNISEVGVAPTSGGDLFTRALIKDGAGVPTTITVLSDEQLQVTYEVRFYPNTTDWVGNVTIAGVVHTVTVRPSAVNTVSNFETALWAPFISVSTDTTFIDFFPITTNAGGALTANTITHTAYVIGTYFRDTTVNASLGELNAGTNAGGTGIKLLILANGPGAWQAKFVPPINKDNTKIMSLKFRLTWGRYII